MTTNKKSNTTTNKPVTTTNTETRPAVTYADHGMLALRYWSAGEQMSGVGQSLAALALAEFMQDEKLLNVPMQGKDKDGMTIIETRVVNLKDFALNRTGDAYTQTERSYINRAIMGEIFGTSVANITDTEQRRKIMAAFKTRLSVAFPPALLLLDRAEKLKVRLAETVGVEVSDNPKVRLPDYMLNDKATKLDDKPTMLTLSFNELKKEANKRKPHHNTKEGGDNKDKNKAKAADPALVGEERFCDAAKIVMLRIRGVNNGARSDLSEKELDMLARLLEEANRYTAKKAAKEVEPAKDKAKSA